MYMCRYDRGMRSRTVLTLWQSLVRPTLEYASEIWSDQIPRYLMQKAEAVQLKFLRVSMGLHKNGSGVANEVIRAEAGCERLQDRWAKLRLGYWRDPAYQLIGMYMLAWSCIKLPRWLFRLWRGPIVRSSTEPRSPIPMRAVGGGEAAHDLPPGPDPKKVRRLETADAPAPRGKMGTS